MGTPAENVIPFGFDMFLHDGPVGNGNLLPAVWNDLRFKSLLDRTSWPDCQMPYDHRGGGLYTTLMFHDKCRGFPINQLTGKFIYSIPMTGGMPEYLCTSSYINKGHSIFDGVSPLALQAIRKGQALLAFDCLYEGHCNDHYHVFDELIHQCHAYDIPLTSTVFVSGNLSSAHPEMAVLPIDWFQSTVRNYRRYLPHQFVDEDEARMAPRSRHFLNFNRMPRPHRVCFVSQMVKHDLTRFFHLSFPSCDVMPFLMSDLKGHTNLPSLYEDIKRLDKAFVIDTEDFQTNQASNHNKQPYLDSFISIVSETWFYEVDREAVFLSEKTYKPIANLHPFIFMGSAGALRVLREKGYRTFAPFIDESYDLECDPYKRMVMICNEIQRLSWRSSQTMVDWYRSILPDLIHNRNVLLSKPDDEEAKTIENYLNAFIQSDTLGQEN